MNAREQILQRIGTALGRPEKGASQTVANRPEAVSERLRNARRSTLPKVGNDLVETAIANMEAVLMSVVRLQTRDNCIDAVQDYLQSQGIDASAPGAVTVAPALSSMAWPSSYRSGPASGDELVSITPCLAAVAETGSVVMASGAQTPAGLNFLPETHITVLYESQIVQYVDDVFAHLRHFDIMPRAVNLVTGPSRTADIEQTLEIGAHGPRRMHVLLIAGEPG
ncbi:LutC/YkgG family protein [Granulosicoccus sp. 3-233]|uniref:LutC/YkgG family protein n=1 Tax=Granulosicoccus sp. 3-233 TaxID=3417969 RepID=UPI003D34A1D3